MRLSIFLVWSRYGLACKYRIISKKSPYSARIQETWIRNNSVFGHFSRSDWMQNCIIRHFWYCIFLFLRSNYNSWAYLATSQVVVMSQMVNHVMIIISSDSNLTQNIIRETIKVGKKRWIKIKFWRIPELMVHLQYDLFY